MPLSPDLPADRLASLMADHSRDAIFVITPDGAILGVNAAAGDMYGYTREEFLQLRVADLRSADAREELRRQLAAANAGGALWETVHQRRDGSTFPVEISSRGVTVGTSRLLVSVVRDIGARKQAEEALRASEERHRALFESSPEGIILIGLDGRLQDANRAQAEMYGYATPEELIGTYAPMFVAPEDRERATAVMQRKLAGEKLAAVEYVLIRKDGTKFLGETTAATVRDARGAVVGYVCVTRDVTARRRAEQETARRADFDEMLAGLLVRVTTCGDEELDGAVTEALAAMARFIGADHAFMLHVGNDTYSATHEWCGEGVVPQRERAQCLPLADRSWQAAHLEAGEVVVLHRLEDLPKEAASQRAFFEKEGARSVLATPTTGPDGRLIGAVGFHRHTTAAPWQASDIAGVRMLGNALAAAVERRRADKARRESEARYRLLAENVSDNIWLFDVRSERFVYVSPSVERQRGFTAEEVMEGGVPAHVMPADAEALRTGLAARIRAFEGGDESARHATYSINLPRKDGGVMPAEISASFITGPDGKVTGVQGVTRDVSERQALQAQLLQAQKMEAVGRLAGGIAHDFNNMLSVIIGHAELSLRRSPPGEPGREDLQEILAAAEHSAELTGQLLAFARRQAIRPRILDLNETIARTLKMLQRIVGDHIELRWRPESGASPVRLDSGQLNQLLVNLAVNARDALPTGGQLTIETSNARVERGRDTPPWLSPGDYVILSVTDTGTGMSPEVLANAFEPFFTTKAPGKGTGLGLSTVYGVVKQHGGFVTLDSQPGRGTTAKVFLPRVDDALAEDRPRGGVERPAGGTETILLVDDSAGVRELSEKILTMLGYRVLSAKDPKEALRIARERPEPVHLLVTDVVLPEMNGLELAAEVEGLKPGIKSLFMSGYTADVITRHGVPQESVHFVQKPFSLAMLAKAVREAIDK